MSHADSDCQTVRVSASDYLDGYLDAGRVALFEDHLSDCDACSLFVEDLGKTVGLLRELCEVELSTQAEAKALHGYLDYYPEPQTVRGVTDPTETKRLWGRLSVLSQEDRVQAVRKDRRFASGPLFDWLLTRAKRMCSRNPEKAVPLAAVALAIARERHRRASDTESLALGLSGLAWCLVALRDYPAANQALKEARPLVGVRGEATEARIAYSIAKGYYYSETGQVAGGQSLLEEVLDSHIKRGDRRQIICAYINLGIPTLNSGNLSKALDLYRAARDLLEVDTDPPRLQLMVFSHLVLALCELGRTVEAAEIMPRVRRLSERVGGWYWRVYVAWLEGTLARCEGRHERAAEIFDAVRGEFSSRGHLVLYLEASLDLARTWYQEGKRRPFGRLAAELMEASQDRPKGDQLRLAVECFAQAVRQESLSSHLIGSLVIALRSAQIGQRAEG